MTTHIKKPHTHISAMFIYLCALFGTQSPCFSEMPDQYIKSPPQPFSTDAIFGMQVPHFSDMPDQYIKSPSHRSSTDAIHNALNAKKWSDAQRLITTSLHKKNLSKSDLERLAKKFPNSPVANAYCATMSILRLRNTGLDFATLFPIALFKETNFDELLKKNQLYIPEKEFGRELQLDPKTKNFFIHLGTHGTKGIGQGKQKTVTKTILYHKNKPQIVARGMTDFDIRREMQAMEDLKNKRGLISVVASCTHKDPKTGKTMRAVLTPIYNRGSLQSVLDDHSIRLTSSEKLKIATDIITGIASLHSSGYVHRDLGAKNYFVSIQQPHSKNRKISCVVADMGRTVSIKEANQVPVQGNSGYLSPEGFFKDKMKGKDYFASDLFAVGCVFWQLYFGKLPPWSAQHYYKSTHHGSLKNRCQYHLHALQNCRSYLRHLMNRLHVSRENAIKRRFLQLIVQMTDPNPSKRGSARQIRKVLNQLSAADSHNK